LKLRQPPHRLALTERRLRIADWSIFNFLNPAICNQTHFAATGTADSKKKTTIPQKSTTLKKLVEPLFATVKPINRSSKIYLTLSRSSIAIHQRLPLRSGGRKDVEATGRSWRAFTAKVNLQRAADKLAKSSYGSFM